MADLVRRLFPTCKAYVRVNAFLEERERYEYGLVSHAFCQAIFSLLLVRIAAVMF